MTPEERAKKWLSWDNHELEVTYLEPGVSEHDKLVNSLAEEFHAAILQEREDLRANYDDFSLLLLHESADRIVKLKAGIAKLEIENARLKRLTIGLKEDLSG